MSDPRQLEEELKRFIIATLDLEDIKPEDISSEMPLFGEGLGLDSVDALELGVAIRKKYGVNLDANPQENRQHFRCIQTLAAMIAGQQSGSH